MKDSNLGWHLPNQNEPMNDDCWSIIDAVPPAAVVLMMGEGVSSENVKRILKTSPGCHVIARWWPCCFESVETVIEKYVSFVIDPGWNSAIPRGQRWLQPWNEVNMRDGLEGFGPELAQIERFNDAFMELCERVRTANPDWQIGFPPLTPGNRDVFFPNSPDPMCAEYYMHGVEAAKPNPTEVEIAAAIKSGPCYKALMAADAYFAHIYCINDPRGEMLADWCGMRWRYMARFLPKPMPIFIPELGISGSANVISYHDYLRTHHPEVISTCLYKLRDEPWNYNGGNPAVKVLKEWYNGLPEDIEPLPDPGPLPPLPPNGDEQMRARIGVHYTNDHNATPAGRDAVTIAKLEAIKVFNYTNIVEGELLRHINPDMEFLCRLWDGRFWAGYNQPSPQAFVEAVKTGLEVWLPLCNKFVIHNEPNILGGEEGWGSSEADAKSFTIWYMSTLEKLRVLFPDAEFGFPGLVPNDPSNDTQWLDWCAKAIEASDFLCCHVYWQRENHLHIDWGLRYHRYIERWPSKRLEIAEWGNTDKEADWGTKTRQYVEWLDMLMEVSKANNIGAAYCYMLESHDDTWEHFCWVLRNGAHREIVAAVGNMHRPPLYGEPVPEPTPDPVPVPEPDPGPDPEPEPTPIEKIKGHTWLLTGIYASTLFKNFARDNNLGPPITRSFVMEGWLAQGFVGGIVVSQDNENCQVVSW